MEGSRGQLPGRSGAQEGETKPSDSFLESSHDTGLACYLERVLVGRAKRASVRRRELTRHASRGFPCGSFKNTHCFQFERHVQKRLCFRNSRPMFSVPGVCVLGGRGG